MSSCPSDSSCSPRAWYRYVNVLGKTCPSGSDHFESKATICVLGEIRTTKSRLPLLLSGDRTNSRCAGQGLVTRYCQAWLPWSAAFSDTRCGPLVSLAPRSYLVVSFGVHRATQTGQTSCGKMGGHSIASTAVAGSSLLEYTYTGRFYIVIFLLCKKPIPI